MRQGILRLSHMASDNDFNLSDGVLESVQDIAPLGHVAHVRRKFERLAADGKNAATPSRRRARSMSWRKTSDTRNRHPRKWRRSERPKLAPFQRIRRLISWTYTNSTPMTKPWGKRRVMPSTYGYALAGRLRDGRFNTDNKLMGQAIRAITHGRKNPFKAAARNDGGRLTKKMHSIFIQTNSPYMLPRPHKGHSLE